MAARLRLQAHRASVSIYSEEGCPKKSHAEAYSFSGESDCRVVAILGPQARAWGRRQYRDAAAHDAES